MKKQILSLLLALVLAVSLLPTSAFAADGESNYSDPPKVGWQVTKNEKTDTESTEAERVTFAAVQYVDTNQFANLTEKDGTTYFNTSKMEINKRDTNTLYLYANDGTLMKGPTVRGCDWKADHNRTDDPLGKDAVKLCRSTNESLLPDDNGAGTPGTGNPGASTPATGVTLWVIALPVTALAAFVLKRKEWKA